MLYLKKLKNNPPSLLLSIKFSLIFAFQNGKLVLFFEDKKFPKRKFLF